jgi:protein O-mannosyl-transferase
MSHLANSNQLPPSAPRGRPGAIESLDGRGIASRRGTFIAAAVIALAGVIAFANSFNGDLIFDDVAWIALNPTIRHLGQLGEVLFPPNNGFASGRPVLNLTLALNYAFVGSDPRSYHVVNIAIHILAGLTLFGILRRTLLSPQVRERFAAVAMPLALGITVLWLVHPLQTAAVSYVIQRTEALVSLFYLLTLYCVIRGADSDRSLRWYSAAVLACLLGMGTKEVMATAPLVVLLYDRTFLSGSFLEAFKRRWGLYLAMAATWGVVVWCLISTGFHTGSTGFRSFPASEGLPFEDKSGAISYAITQPGVILRYLRLTFWPAGQCLDYHLPAAKWPDEFVVPAFVIAALVGLMIWGLIKNPPLGFLGAWFFVILSPTSSIIPIRDAAFEHRMYLPLAAIAALVVIGGFAIWKRLLVHSADVDRSSVARRWSAPICLLAAAIIALSVATIRRNEVLGSGVSAWENVLEFDPNSARAHNNLAAVLIDERRLDESIVHSRRALELTPGYADAENNLGHALSLQGKTDEAIASFRRALRDSTDHPRALQNLAKALYDRKQFAEAADLYRRFVLKEPDNAEAHFLLANCIREHDPSLAIACYRRAIELFPDYAEAHNNLAGALARQGKAAEAVEHFETAIRLKPDHADAHYNLGMIFYGRGQNVEAEQHWRAAVRLKPTRIEYLRPLAWALATSPEPASRNGSEAVELAERAVQFSEKPDPAVIGTLAAADAETGRFAEAVKNARQALELATTQHDDQLANELRERVKLYESGKPFHDVRQ